MTGDNAIKETELICDTDEPTKKQIKYREVNVFVRHRGVTVELRLVELHISLKRRGLYWDTVVMD